MLKPPRSGKSNSYSLFDHDERGKRIIEDLEMMFREECQSGAPLVAHECLMKRAVVEYIKKSIDSARKEMSNGQ